MKCARYISDLNERMQVPRPHNIEKQLTFITSYLKSIAFYFSFHHIFEYAKFSKRTNVTEGVFIACVAHVSMATLSKKVHNLKST